MMSKEELPICPVATAIRVIGSKWKLMILSELLKGTRRYNELRYAIPQISQKVLTENLKQMQSDGVVIRTAYAEVPPRVEYSLSELGAEINTVMDYIGEWGESYQAYVRNADFELSAKRQAGQVY